MSPDELQTDHSWKRQWRHWRDMKRGLGPTETIEFYESIDRFPVLLLWGEPGIGKTHELQKAFNCLGPKFAEFISLRSVVRAEDLRQVLDRSASFRAWQDADVATWTLFLDGFDEACVPREVLHTWLSSAFRLIVGASTKRRTARIRITGRVAGWSKLVENDLRDLWGWDAVATYELEPLGAEHVLQVFNAPALIEQIEHLGFTTVAQTPLGLCMLREVSQHGAVLPSSIAALYLTFLRCNGDHRSDFMAALLGRIAAASILGSKPLIWTGPSGNAPHNAIDVADLAGGHEIIDGSAFDVTALDIREVIEIGPFTPIGDNSFEWKHQTFTEFFAAKWLTRVTKASSLFDVLSWNYVKGRRIHSHLKELARWSAAFSNKFQRTLIQHDQDVLLESHMAHSSHHDRRRLLQAFLDCFATSERHEVHNDPTLNTSRQ